jgi:hypothetical protein
MNPYMNEEIGWQRLQDEQREAENRRLLAGGEPLAPVRLVSLVGELTRSLVRSVRPRWWSEPARAHFDERDTTRDVA